MPKMVFCVLISDMTAGSERIFIGMFMELAVSNRR